MYAIMGVASVIAFLMCIVLFFTDMLVGHKPEIEALEFSYSIILCTYSMLVSFGFHFALDKMLPKSSRINDHSSLRKTVQGIKVNMWSANARIVLGAIYLLNLVLVILEHAIALPPGWGIVVSAFELLCEFGAAIIVAIVVRRIAFDEEYSDEARLLYGSEASSESY